MSSRLKKMFDWASWLALIALIAYLLLPNFITVGPATVSESEVLLINGETRNLADPSEKLVIVFWATWCPPCKLELARINRMVENNPAWAEKIVAISISEDAKTVSAAAAERGYKFQVAYDIKSSTAARYEIESTPTVLLKDLDNKFAWRASGISPSLELRLNSFLD